MNLGAAGKALIQSFEELRLVAYPDQKGVWTIGWGHTGPEVVEGLTCTPEQADRWFEEDTAHAVHGVERSLIINPGQNKFDALVSFAFNVGVGAEAHSTMIGYINQGLWQRAADEFPKWNHVDGVPNAGLTRRREAERTLFLS